MKNSFLILFMSFLSLSSISLTDVKGNVSKTKEIQPCDASCADIHSAEDFKKSIRCAIHTPYKNACTVNLKDRIDEVLSHRIVEGIVYDEFQNLPISSKEKVAEYLKRITLNTTQKVPLDLEILRRSISNGVLGDVKYPKDYRKLLTSNLYPLPLALGKVYFTLNNIGLFGQILVVRGEFASSDSELFYAREVPNAQEIKSGDWIVIYNFKSTREWESRNYDSENPFIDKKYLQLEAYYNVYGLITRYVTYYKKYESS